MGTREDLSNMANFVFTENGVLRVTEHPAQDVNAFPVPNRTKRRIEYLHAQGQGERALALVPTTIVQAFERARRTHAY